MEKIQDTFPADSPLSAVAEREMDLEAPQASPFPDDHRRHPPQASPTPSENASAGNSPKVSVLAPSLLPSRPRLQPLHPEWLSLIVGFGFVALSIRSQCSNSTCRSFSFHMACLCLALALSALTVSKYVPEKLQTMAQILEHVGVFCGFTAFFVAITPTFPLYFLIISWIVYALSIIVIVLSHYLA